MGVILCNIFYLVSHNCYIFERQQSKQTLMRISHLAMTLGLALSTSFMALAQSKADQIIKDWERAKAYTQDYLQAMPGDKFDYKAAPEVRSFAQQMLHIADANYMFFAVATGTQSPIERGESEKTEDTSKENVTRLVL